MNQERLRNYINNLQVHYDMFLEEVSHKTGKEVFDEIYKYFTIDKMPPIPNKKYQKLYADFENEKVWYDTRELTEEEINQERIEEIHQELNQLDTTINRATEDLYILTDLKAYDTIEEVITKKEELRK